MRTAKGRNLTETVIAQASLVSIVTLHVEVYVGDHWFSVVLVASTTSIFNFRIFLETRDVHVWAFMR
jgi:hypothetical protein